MPPPHPASPPPLLERVCALVRAAGAEVMAVYAGEIEVRGKVDASPLTLADERAEQVLVAGLRELTPGVPVVAEEACARGQVPAAADRFWLVDPLDGTKEFVARNGEFTVNVALVEHGRPVLGVVYAPATDHLYAGEAALGAFVERAGHRAPIASRVPPAAGLTVVGSRSHGDQDALRSFLGGQRVAEWLVAGSSLKLCLLAEGRADCYPRLGRTMEWDIAAGQAVLEAAGGRVVTLDGSALGHGKPGFENPHFVAWGRC